MTKEIASKEIASKELATLAPAHLERSARLVSSLTATELKFGARYVEPTDGYSRTLERSGILYTRTLHED